jgi:uncharacterized protein
MRVWLGHGASGNAASMAPFVEGLRRRGIEAGAVDLPKRKAEDAVPAWRAAVPDGAATIAGGHSYGGRVASLAAAAGAGYAGLVLFSFPLHPPGQPNRTDPRIAHFPAIDCPALFLSGEADPFARLELLRAAVTRVPRATLVTYPRLGHTLKPVLDDVLERVGSFVEELERMR